MVKYQQSHLSDEKVGPQGKLFAKDMTTMKSSPNSEPALSDSKVKSYFHIRKMSSFPWINILGITYITYFVPQTQIKYE